MARGQAAVLIIGLTLMGLSIVLIGSFVDRHPVVVVLPFFFAISTALILGGRFGYQAFRSARIRRTGVPVTGRVIHARQAGSVNRVPNYEVEVELPRGTTAKLQVRRWGGFLPGQPLTVVVSDRYPGYAALPRVNRDF